MNGYADVILKERRNDEKKMGAYARDAISFAKRLSSQLGCGMFTIPEEFRGAFPRYIHLRRESPPECARGNMCNMSDLELPPATGESPGEYSRFALTLGEVVDKVMKHIGSCLRQGSAECYILHVVPEAAGTEEKHAPPRARQEGHQQPQTS